MPELAGSLKEKVQAIVSDVALELTQRLTKAFTETLNEAVDGDFQKAPSTARPPRSGRAALAGSSKKASGRAQKSRPRAKEITRWVPDARARRVPNFVIKATGLDTKAKIVEQFGDKAVFEKGKPAPKAAK